MALRIAELESLFTADIRPYQADAARLESDRRAIAGRTTTIVVDANSTSALSDLARVESSARGLPDADIDVTADTSSAQADLAGLGDEGAAAGEDAGKGLSAGIIGALATIPIAGAVVGIGVAIGKSLMDGLQVEVRSDRLMAQTGLDEKTVAILARASGEAYADNFGESIAANMDTARVAVQSGLLDPKSTARDSQDIIASLSGVADVLGEDIPRVSRSTATLLRTGLAKDAQGAFDLIVKGAQSGLNVSEDLLDTFDEYSTQFRVLGLEGPQALGLLSQAVKNGARDTDTAADALKEFAIRAVDGSETTAAAYAAIGLSAEEMAARVIAGGPTSAAALELTLTKLREMEPGAERTAAAVGLFGTKAEDLGDALYSMDLSTAVAQLGNVEGAAKSALETLGDNAAGSIASAQRNIEVAADGIKGALATAFGPQIEGFATFVSENREAVMQFLLDIANGGLDAGRALANAAADGIEGFGDLVGTAGPALMGFIESLLTGFAAVAKGMDPTGILGIKDAAKDALNEFKGIRESAEKGYAAVDKGAETAADAIRENLIEKGINPAQDKLNEVAIPLVAQAALHDASVRLAGDLDGIGYAADGSKLALDTLNGTVDTGTESGRILDEQIRAMVASLDAETAAGIEAEETQDALNIRYAEGRDALIRQLEQMGYTTEQAQALADTYGAIPGKVETVIAAETAAAQADIEAYLARNDGRRITIRVDAKSGETTVNTGVGNYVARADGGITGHADGALRVPQIAKGGANILWAEDETDWEAYISGKPSMKARNRSILAEAARRLGFEVIPAGAQRHADGAISTPASLPMPGRSGPLVSVTVERLIEATPSDLEDRLGWAMMKAGLS